ncbi:hypothetical protein ANCCAN_26496 [Ancylostoma caninum]|uniref:Carboxypeptidase activation peptide domain-containing protein n=1 Tax=Ancylostoma caninum TaxID=29170 RepID=A0A368F9T6_ANCCA|nr:hypothetical protein ANCCAN_26496 [Ancylostoma caninum]
MFVLSTPRKPHARYTLIRFTANEALAKWLAEMESEGYEINEVTEQRRVLLDVWGEPSRKNPVADVLVAPEFLGTFLNMLSKRGVTYVETLKEDIGR